jgi:hypothetical protein
MRRAKRVVDVEVAQLREAARQALVVRLFAAEEARVLEQDDVRVRVVRRVDRLIGVRAFDEDDLLARQQLVEAARHGVERVFGLRLSLRPAEVRQQDHARAAIEQRANRRQRGANPRVVGNRAAVEGDVEVHAHQRALSAHFVVAQVCDGFLIHGS